MRRALRILIVLAVLASSAGGWWFWRERERRAAEEASRVLTATGTVEATEAEVTVRVSGYLRDWILEEGRTVRRGEILGRLEIPELAAQIARDEATLRRAEALLADLRAGARSMEKEEIQAEVRALEARAELTRVDYRRFDQLFREGVVSRAEFDRYAEALKVAEQNLRAGRERAALVDAGSRSDTIAAQEADVRRARAALEVTRSVGRDAVIRSPLDGVVLTKRYERGEMVPAGSSIGTIADRSDLWVKVYVPSAQLGRIRLGQPADVRVDAYPDRVFPGRISHVSQEAEYTPRQSLTERERANLVFAVKVKVDGRDGILKPGMPADVRIGTAPR